MSKIHFLQSKETTIGISLLVGLVLLLVVNLISLGSSMISVYGAQKTPTKAQTIDDSTLSQAIKVLEPKE